jgi:hypothetical protein
MARFELAIFCAQGRRLTGLAHIPKTNLVGTGGFEPPTSPTPRVRDTKLRYVPKNNG